MRCGVNVVCRFVGLSLPKVLMAFATAVVQEETTGMMMGQIQGSCTQLARCTSSPPGGAGVGHPGCPGHMAVRRDTRKAPRP